jgi:hypothetical protein
VCWGVWGLHLEALAMYVGRGSWGAGGGYSSRARGVGRSGAGGYGEGDVTDEWDQGRQWAVSAGRVGPAASERGRERVHEVEGG